MVGALTGLYAAAIGITIAGIGVVVASIFPNFMLLGDFVGTSTVVSFLIGIGLTAFGILFAILDIYITKLFYKLTVKYLNWNIEIIKK